MMQALLTLNTGSSSIKFRLFGLAEDLPFLLGGKVTDIGGNPVFQVHEEEHSKDTTEALPLGTTQHSAMDFILHWLESHNTSWKLAAAAHRIVHGGTRYTHAARLTPETRSYLASLNPLAPLHQPHNLAAVDALAKLHPNLPQYGCFDTAFHMRHDPLFSTYALPLSLREQGVRRYGFHGLSYQWIARCLALDFPHLAQGKVVAAHLGNGSSLCALKDSKSIDTTMGMTALDGLPMGTRCGSIDAGAVFYMQRDLGIALPQLEQLLYEESGLKGLSGISNDVKTLLENSSESARFTLDFYALKAAQCIVSMAVSLGGLEALIFTGGIGEHAAPVREEILKHLAFLPAFEAHVIAANEERGMALEVYETFGKELIR